VDVVSAPGLSVRSSPRWRGGADGRRAGLGAWLFCFGGLLGRSRTFGTVVATRELVRTKCTDIIRRKLAPSENRQEKPRLKLILSQECGIMVGV
jgi:hypothetical protein